MMKKMLLLFLVWLLCVSLLAQSTRNARFAANGEYDDTETVPSGFGLEKIYVFKNLQTATISYQTASSNTVNIYTYQQSMSDKIAVSSVDINLVTVGDRTTYTVSNLQDSRALMVDDNNQTHSVWMIDYKVHKPMLRSITAVESEDRCEMLKLVVDKEDILQFRGIGGQIGNINRKYDVSYEVLEWNAENFQFVKKEYIEENLSVGREIILDRMVPNMNTQFTIRGDQFGQKFGIAEEQTSAEYEAVRVEAHIKAVQAPTNGETQEQAEVELGGSAPVDIAFGGYGNEPAAYYYIWFVYNTKDMEDPVARFTDKNFDYTFQQSGNYEVVLEVANRESSCVNTNRVVVKILESQLKIPNFFSPGSSPGSNDEFKVYYKSLVKYHCVIFNRWGNKVFETRDPAQGWDGRYKGRLVNPGVYFYSIQATGSDDTKYDKGGDINILR